MNEQSSPEKEIEAIYQEGKSELEAIERDQKNEIAQVIDKLKQEKIADIRNQL